MDNIANDMICNAILFFVIYKLVWKRMRAKRTESVGIPYTLRGNIVAFAAFVILFCASVFAPVIYSICVEEMTPVAISLAMLFGIVLSFMISLRMPVISIE